MFFAGGFLGGGGVGGEYYKTMNYIGIWVHVILVFLSSFLILSRSGRGHNGSNYLSNYLLDIKLVKHIE